MRYQFILITIIIGLAACSGSVEEILEPAPLVAITEEAKVKPKWRTRVIANTKVRSKLGVYIHGGKLFAASHKGDVYAIDQKNGRVIWSKKLKVPVSSGIGGDQKSIIFGTHHAQVFVLNQSDGKLVWQSDVSSEVLSTPILHKTVSVVRTSDGKLYGLSRDSGKSLWVYGRKVPPLSLYGNSEPVVFGDTVYAGFDNGRLVAISLSDGKVRWETQLGIPSGRSELERMVDIDASPVLDQGVIYAVSFQGAIAAVDSRTGRKLWIREFSSHSGLAIDLHNVYVTDVAGNVWALNRQNGSTFWKQEKLKNRQLSGPAMHGDYIAVGDYEGYIHWLSREDGRIIARLQVDEAPILLSPQFDGEKLYSKSQLGEITAIILKPKK